MCKMNFGGCSTPSGFSPFLYSQWQSQAHHGSAWAEGKGSKYLGEG